MTFLTFAELNAQTKDTTYTYDVCIHIGDYGKLKTTSNTKYLENTKTSTITGEVCDGENHKIKNAVVTLYLNNNDTIVRKILPESNSIFTFSELKLGTYLLVVVSEGYLSEAIENIRITKPMEVSFTFHLGRGNLDVIKRIESKKKLNNRQLNRRIKQLQKSYNT